MAIGDYCERRRWVKIPAQAFYNSTKIERTGMNITGLASFINEAPVPVAMFDRDMRYLAASDSWIDLHRFSRPIEGKSHYELFPNIPEQWKEAHRRVLAGETLTALDDEYRLPTGERKWAAWGSSPWRHDNGEIGGITIFAYDIHAQKEQEIALQETESKLKLAQVASRIGLFDWNLLSNENGANDRYYDIFGIERGSALTYEVFLSCLHPDDRARVAEADKYAIANLTPLEQEFRIIRKNDHQLRYVRATGAIFCSQNNTAVRCTGTVQDITEVKETEIALKESELRYRYAIDATNDGIWDWNLVTNDVTYGPGYYRMLGYSEEDWSAKTIDVWIDFLHPDDRDRAVKTARERLVSPGFYEMEFRLLAKDDSYRWIRSRGKVVERDNAGAPTRVVGTHIDITTEKEVTRLLQESRADLQHAQAIAHVGSWRMNVKTNELTWSEEAHRIFGKPIGEKLTYESFLSIVHPHDLYFVDRKWKAALNGELYDIEHRILVNNETRWVRERAELEFDEDGKILGGFGTTQDITERVESWEKLQKTLSILSAALKSMNDSVFITDQNGKVVQFNDAFVRFHRFKTRPECPEDFEGFEKIFEVRNDKGELIPMDQWAVPRALSGEESMGLERYLRRKDTGETWIGSVNFSPIHDSDGNIIGAVVAGHDITKRKQAEKEILELNRNLELRVKERTEQLALANQALIELSRHDALTGLLNRLAADEILRSEFMRMKRTKDIYAVLMVDIDFFKKINDTFGHGVGDNVLTLLAKTFKNTLRESDFVFRYGGEEFLVILPVTNFESAYVVAEKLRCAVASSTHPEAGEFHISIGIAMALPEQADEEVAVREADEQLYVAKACGRNRVMPGDRF